MGPEVLVQATRDVVRQVIEADLRLRRFAEDYLRRGGPWYAIGPVAVDMSFEATRTGEEIRFGWSRGEDVERLAQLRVQVSFGPSLEPVADCVPRPVLMTRAMDFVEIEPAERALEIETAVGWLLVELDDERVSLNGDHEDWPVEWIAALLRRVGDWSRNEDDGAVRYRSYAADAGTDRELIATVALQMHELALEFVGTSGVSTIEDDRLTALRKEAPLSEALGRHYRLEHASAVVDARVGPQGRFVSTSSPDAGARLELEVRIEPSLDQLHVSIERGIAGIVVGDERTAILGRLQRHVETLRQRFAELIDRTPSELAFERFIEDTMPRAVVADRGDGARHFVLLGSPWDHRAAMFGLDVVHDEASEDLEVSPVGCIAGKWDGSGSDTFDLLIAGDSDGDHGRLHAYASVLLRSLEHWVFS